MESLATCDGLGKLWDPSGALLATFVPYKTLGEGTFSKIDAFYRNPSEAEGGGEAILVALKRPKNRQLNFFYEAMFQWKLWHDLKPYSLSKAVPEVYDIFRYSPTGDVWFTMEAFQPHLLSHWCVENIPKKGGVRLFVLLLLQVALILDVFENALRIDHRDLKVNNILIVDEPISIPIQWKGVNKNLVFPFRVVFIDFGWACIGKYIDVREGDGLPPFDMCPKEGRDIFQILVSIWSIQTLRQRLESIWGEWVWERLRNTSAGSECLKNIFSHPGDMNWVNCITDDTRFRAPLCVPSVVIEDCMRALDE